MSLRRRCHVGAKLSPHQGCVPNRSTSSRSAEHVEEEILLHTQDRGVKSKLIPSGLAGGGAEGYPCSTCQRTQRSHRARSAASVSFSSSGGGGRRPRVSGRSDSVRKQEGVGLLPADGEAFSPARSQTSSPAACCDGCR